ncbi:DUF445 domain-containing protein [Agreia sp. COWG]|uniref:DUF445 domain-containing protein n=1 Tax=Agreia sp. COWG TaxID=2773266 RepID=UPI001926FF2B|nr:DUF445 domain-containing protein [Agreia sp. COWG]CAD5996176.1 conserved protein of unknown function [Agreia sp. COWG]
MATPLTQPAASTDLLSARDLEKLAALRSMKRLATGLLVIMAVIFVVAFALQERIEWLQYVRAAAEGGMVGAIADWFAVTALFRHPLGLKIPHTAIIPTQKDQIGVTLGDFVETNFLSREVITTKLRSLGVSRSVGAWLIEPAHASRLTSEAANAARGFLSLVDDDTMREVIEEIGRRQLIDPEWGPPLGRMASTFVEGGHQHQLVDLLVERLGDWLERNPDAFGQAVSERLPSWMPSFVDRVVDDRAHREAMKFISAVRDDPHHQLRVAIDEYLRKLSADLQNDPATMNKVEELKAQIFDSPQVRDLAGKAWNAARTALITALEDPESELRVRLSQAVTQFGQALLTDELLAAKVDRWVEDAAGYLVETYRHDLAAIITDTVRGWDAEDTSKKLEVEVGRDLQFIRINGTVVGSLAGLAIFTVAHAIFGS